MEYHVISYQTRRIVSNCDGMGAGEITYYKMSNLGSYAHQQYMYYSGAKFLVESMYKMALKNNLPEWAPEWSVVIVPRGTIGRGDRDMNINETNRIEINID